MNLLKQSIAVIGMALMISSCARYVPIPDKAKNGSSGLPIVMDQTTRGNRVLIYSYGSKPVELHRNVIQINGYMLVVYQANHEDPVFSEYGGEIESDAIIDLADFKHGTIRITSTTEDPRWPDQKHIPFAEKTITILPEAQTRIASKILMELEPPDPKRIDKLFSQTISLSNRYHQDPGSAEFASTTVCNNLAHIRNMSSEHPDEILKRLRSLPDLPGDCSCGHMIRGYLHEVEEIRMAQQSKESEHTPRPGLN